MLLAPTIKSSSTSMSHGIAPMAVPSWYTGHCAPVPCVGIMGSSKPHILVPHRTMVLCPWLLQLSHCTKLRHPRTSTKRRWVTPGPVSLWSRGAHHICRGAHMCVLECRLCVLGTPKAMPWCLLGAVKVFSWYSLESLFPS